MTMKSVFEKIIERLEEKCFRYFDEGYGSESVIKKSDAIEIVNQVAEEYGDGWIPCSVKMPDSTAEVNVTIRPFTVSVASFFEETNEWLEWRSGNGIPVDVIAWQPLPLFYQLKETEE